MLVVARVVTGGLEGCFCCMKSVCTSAVWSESMHVCCVEDGTCVDVRRRAVLLNVLATGKKVLNLVSRLEENVLVLLAVKRSNAWQSARVCVCVGVFERKYTTS